MRLDGAGLISASGSVSCKSRCVDVYLSNAFRYPSERLRCASGECHFDWWLEWIWSRDANRKLDLVDLSRLVGLLTMAGCLLHQMGSSTCEAAFSSLHLHNARDSSETEASRMQILAWNRGNRNILVLPLLPPSLFGCWCSLKAGISWQPPRLTLGSSVRPR